MNSSEYFAAFLHAVGIERAYTLSGGMIAPLLDAIGEHPQLKFVAVSHEQSAAFAAETEGQLGNKPGVAIGCMYRKPQKPHDFAKFPVKFPVSRENGQSRGPSALLRQPISPVFPDI